MKNKFVISLILTASVFAYAGGGTVPRDSGRGQCNAGNDGNRDCPAGVSRSTGNSDFHHHPRPAPNYGEDGTREFVETVSQDRCFGKLGEAINLGFNVVHVDTLLIVTSNKGTEQTRTVIPGSEKIFASTYEIDLTNYKLTYESGALEVSRIGNKLLLQNEIGRLIFGADATLVGHVDNHNYQLPLECERLSAKAIVESVPQN